MTFALNLPGAIAEALARQMQFLTIERADGFLAVSSLDDLAAATGANLIAAGLGLRSSPGSNTLSADLELLLRARASGVDAPMVLLSILSLEDVVPLLPSDPVEAGHAALPLDSAGAAYLRLPADPKAVLKAVEMAHQTGTIPSVAEVRHRLRLVEYAEQLRRFRHDEKNHLAALRVLHGGLLSGELPRRLYGAVLDALTEASEPDIRRLIEEHQYRLLEIGEEAILEQTTPAPLNHKGLLIDDEWAAPEWHAILNGIVRYSVGVDLQPFTLVREGLGEAIRRKDLDLVILDLHFKGQEMSGLDALVEMHDKRPDLPVLVLTADDYEYTARQCAKLGAWYFLKELRDDALPTKDAAYYRAFIKSIRQALSGARGRAAVAAADWLRRRLPADDRTARYVELAASTLAHPRLSLTASGLALEALVQDHYGQVLSGREWTLDSALNMLSAAGDLSQPASDLLYCCKNLRNAAVHEETAAAEGITPLDAEIAIWALIAGCRAAKAMSGWGDGPMWQAQTWIGRLLRQCAAAGAGQEVSMLTAATRHVNRDWRKAVTDLQRALGHFLPYVDRGGNVRRERFDSFVRGIPALQRDERVRAELARQRCLMTGATEWDDCMIEAVAALTGIAVRLARLKVS